MDDYIEDAINVINIEISALDSLKKIIGDGFIKTIQAIKIQKGKTVLTGVGKSGIIAKKIAATLSSLGTPSFFIHPNDAMHGDLGMITCDDIVIAISNSGESDELLRIIPNIKMIGAKLIAITNNEKSNLALRSDIICPIPKVKEACIMNMAPTSSTTATLVLGDAIAVVLSKIQQFNKENFAKYHPAGTLGKSLTTHVSDVMHCGDENAIILSGTTLKTALFEISSKYLGAAIVVGKCKEMLGLITDGDIRRAIDKGVDIKNISVDDIMTRNPITINENSLALDALMIMQNYKKHLSCLPVIDENNSPVGMITASDILKLGIVY